MNQRLYDSTTEKPALTFIAELGELKYTGLNHLSFKRCGDEQTWKVDLRVNVSKNKKNRGHGQTIEFVHTLSV